MIAGAALRRRYRPETPLFPNRALVALILPLIVEQLLAVLVGLADSIMVASVGEAAVSGVSLVDSIMLLLINVFAALATGGAVIAGQYMGQEKNDKGCEASNQLVWFILLSSLGIMGLLYAARPFILQVVFGRITEEVRTYADTYLLITAASIPFIALYNAGAAVFRAMGNSKISMIVSMIMNAVNVGGNALLIFGLHWKVEGVAIPTLVSRIVAAVLILLLLLLRQDLPLHLPRTLRYRFNGGMVKKILYIGIPNGLENSMFQLGKIIVLSLVSTFGTYAITANAVGNTLAAFQILPAMAINLAVTTVVSRCIGAGDFRQAQYYIKKLHLILYVCSWLTILVIQLALPLILRVYHLSDQTADEVHKILLFHGICSAVAWAPAFTLPAAFRAAGDVKFPLVVSLFSMWMFRVVFSYILGQYLGMGLLGVWAAMVLDWIVRAIFFLPHYFRGSWKKGAMV
ncbi:MAG: MATE family efflux transporter [Clostridiales bacterium]|nr:MATE family efflux transporter [Clostridiales bacterium]